MEVVRKFMDAEHLMSVMALPEAFKNRKLEVIVLPAEEKAVPRQNAPDVDEAIQSLIGAVPYTDMPLSELREERLQKYEIID